MNDKEIFEPLEKYTPKEIWDYMMFMRTVGDIYLYKHVNTRRYINVDIKGVFYRYTGEDDNPYIEVDKDMAIQYCLS